MLVDIVRLWVLLFDSHLVLLAFALSRYDAPSSREHCCIVLLEHRVFLLLYAVTRWIIMVIRPEASLTNAIKLLFRPLVEKVINLSISIRLTFLVHVLKFWLLL